MKLWSKSEVIDRIRTIMIWINLGLCIANIWIDSTMLVGVTMGINIIICIELIASIVVNNHNIKELQMMSRALDELKEQLRKED